MSSGPKEKDYQPGEMEKFQAAQALEDQRVFSMTYDPILRDLRDRNRRQDLDSTYLGRANFDAMEALTGRGIPTLDTATGIEYSADVASGAIANLLNADVQAADAKNKEAAGILGTSRGQQAITTSALANVGRLSASETLADAAAKQTGRMSNVAALTSIGRGAIPVIGRAIKSYNTKMDTLTPITGSQGLYSSGGVFSNAT